MNTDSPDPRVQGTIHCSPAVVSGLYHLTDHQFSTVALLDNAANLVERVTYDAYGMARHHWKGDITGDGAVDSADRSLALAAHNTSIGDSAYNVDADMSRTGTVETGDLHWFGTSQFKAALPMGDLSVRSIGNTIGYCGYVFNPEVPSTNGGGGFYTVRFRHYDAEFGRWLERDPLGYVDGMNLYGYGIGNPLGGTDPMGLNWFGDAWDWVKDRILGGSNPIHEWIADNIVTPVLGVDVLVDTHPAILYGGGVLASIVGGVLIYYGAVFIASEMGHLMLSNATYQAMIRAIGPTASGLARFRWLVANGHAVEMLTYWFAHPIAFLRFIGATWPPTWAARIGGPILAYMLYRWTKYVWHHAIPDSSAPARMPLPASPSSPVPTSPRNPPNRPNGHGGEC